MRFKQTGLILSLSKDETTELTQYPRAGHRGQWIAGPGIWLDDRAPPDWRIDHARCPDDGLESVRARPRASCRRPDLGLPCRVRAQALGRPGDSRAVAGRRSRFPVGQRRL